ncbi:hypothetical protein [Marixanthomonas spongiae]|uniref:Uncharacterized protein n=1 Tax=Marixanthomonas spongiae TaxID=2174845 RepID=A0A2U0HYM2_9FLAO|nr:hypothetical protein [Marixanthomonas spongiae]PVW13840.1 hypothetical protein DDV96_11845 [Marixanthomonas spongiae]
MKKAMYSVITVFFIAFTSVYAQENKNVHKETVTKKVTVKDTKVDTKVVQEVKEDNEVVKVEGTNEQDQNAKVITSKSGTSEQVVADEVSVDAGNAEKIMQNRNRMSEELKASIQNQKAEAEKRRQILLKKKMERQKELEQRRQELESRPDGMAKLKKDD